MKFEVGDKVVHVGIREVVEVIATHHDSDLQYTILRSDGSKVWTVGYRLRAQTPLELLAGAANE